VKIKYTKNDILNKCKKIKNRKEFRRIGLNYHAEKLNILNECYSILDKNKNDLSEIKKQKLIQEIDEKIKNKISKSSFFQQYPQYSYILRYNKFFSEKYKNSFINQKYSTQQLICKKILETILNEKCEYNSRKVLKNKTELDIFFPKYNIAFEYNSFYWHKNTKKTDNIKKNTCRAKNIKLFCIYEPSLNAFSTLEKSILGIKEQIKKFITLLNKMTNLKITEIDVENVKIEEKDLMYNCYTKEDLDYIFNKCDRYSEIKNKYNKIWQYILRNKLLHLLYPVKKRDYIHMNDGDFIEWVLSKFNSYTDFTKHKSYKLQSRKKLRKNIKILFDKKILGA
jgi:hypothetical protein